jgi:uncharacterized repeat protein (TIGR03803 family)
VAFPFAAPAQAATETVMHSFDGRSSDGEGPYAGLINVGGTLYGTTEEGDRDNSGTVFSVATAGVEKVLHLFGSGA